MRLLLFKAATVLALGLTISSAMAQDLGPAKLGQSPSGPILTDGRGMSLYTYVRDMSGYSNCNGPCAAAWPPFAASTDAAAHGDWAPIVRDEGGRQWSYKASALYLFSKDAKPGDVTGEGAGGGKWHVARP